MKDLAALGVNPEPASKLWVQGQSPGVNLSLAISFHLWSNFGQSLFPFGCFSLVSVVLNQLRTKNTNFKQPLPLVTLLT